MDSQHLYTIVTIAILVAIIILFFVTSIVMYHRRYVALQKERIFAEITMQENERKRIATDLHDGIGPLLSTIKLNINSIDVVEEGDRLIVSKAGKHIDEIIKSMRQISYNLLPNTLERKGLIEALKEFVEHTNENKALQVHLQIVQYFEVPPEKSIHIFRMLQEIVHNTVKHAKAQNLQIGLGAEGNHILILTKDDGCGFDPLKERDKLSGGLGLKSIESRAEVLNAKMVMDTQPSKGTSYFIKIPI
ncbi:sensor histidine kinase [Pinibacter soli]|uniref:Histidine kinase n=1 Tax=Pinibacter soli TaxID=3044211 RepID=A0ABT6RIJ3_9BACT|nr:ATP-binding protein [Pinibacter soli]MDI3322391.1 histidine kinase [Pinibacter soli]